MVIAEDVLEGSPRPALGMAAFLDLSGYLGSNNDPL